MGRKNKDVGEYWVKYLDDYFAIRRISLREAARLVRRILRGKEASLIGLRRDSRGRTIFVDHLVVRLGRKGNPVIKHYGIHGVRGWDPDNPGMVQFKNLFGEDVEFEEIGIVTKFVGKGRRTYIRRTRRVKKAGKRRY